MAKTDHVKSALAYARDVVAGKVPAGELARQACQRQLDDLEREWGYTFDAERANRVCRFIENLPHTKGRWAAKREYIRLSPWQQFVVTTLFGWVDSEGKRRFREAYIEVPRKNGKSTLAAGVGLWMFVADGEFGAEVYSGATTEKQAWEVFRPARLMARREPDFREYYGVEVNASNLNRMEDASRFEPVIGNPGDGASPNCALIDEYHEHADSRLFDTMQTGMGAREQPLMFTITTAGSNLSGPCYEKRAYVKNLLAGSLENEELFGLIYTLDDGDDWTTEEALRKANPNYDVSVSGDFLKARQREATQSAARQNSFKTKHLNLWVGAKAAWMNMQRWALCPARKSLAELVGRECYVGLDLASKIDVAAMVFLFPPAGDDPLWHVHGKYYLPEARVEEAATSNAAHYDNWAKQGVICLTPGNIIDFEYIKDDLLDATKQFDIRAVPYDPWQATQLATELLAEGAPMIELRNTVGNFSEPMKKVEALVIDQKLAHGNCPVLTWMTSNVVAKLDAKDNIYPRKEIDDSKIDGMVALIMAMNRALLGEDDMTVIGSDYEPLVV